MEEFHPECFESDNLPTQMLLHQVMHMQRQLVNQLMGPVNLKPIHAWILVILDRNGPLSLREIADRIKVKPPSVTVAVQKLEKMGYIEKRPDEKDQRIVRIEINESGRASIREIEELLKSAERAVFRNMNREELLLLRRLVLQMKENLLKEFKSL